MRSNKVRTGLTVLGMVIGIASVIIVFSAGQGIRGLILGQVESFGTDIIETEIKVPSGNKSTAEAEQQSATNLAMGVQITTLDLEDLHDIEKLPNISKGYGAILSQKQVGYGNEIKKSFIFGTNAGYIDIDKSEVKEGRFFTEAENNSLAKVVVLGKKIKEDLFGNSNAIGKSIKLHNSKYKVIGIMEERGAVMTMDFDEYVYIPVKTLQKRIMGIEHLTYMVHQVIDMDRADLTAERMRTILRENHNISSPSKNNLGKSNTDNDDFRVVTMQEMMDIMNTVTGALTILLLAIVAISLLVGGVGIMNIMYVIVSERTKEIGLRKAVGAKYRDIMLQFLTESILITLAGGIAGIAIGIGTSYILAIGADSYGLDWNFEIPIRAYAVALGFSLLFGILFGLYPARKAAQLDPITALRDE